MTARNEHVALKAAGLVYVKGWIRAEDVKAFVKIMIDAAPEIGAALAVKRKRGRPRKETK